MVCKVEEILEQPSKNQLERIREEINEDADRLNHFQHLLYTWMDSQPHFPKKYEKAVVRNFLRNCKYNMDKTKKKLEYHFVAKHLHPSFYSGRSPFAKEIVRAMDAVSIVPLPKLTEQGRRIYIIKVEDSDSSNFEIHGAFKLFLMIYDLLLMDQHPIGGEIAIFDGSGLSPNHCIKCIPLMKAIIALLKEAYSIRLKEIHIVNSSPMLEKILNFTKPFLHHKVRKAFITHTTEESLCDYFGADLLPSNYGGKCKPLRELMKYCQEALNNNANWFLEQEGVKITNIIPERIESTFYFNDQLGVDGSFRKLNID